jgi:WD40 repeat protein
VITISGIRTRDGELPADLLAELQPRIEEPTLGKWRGMAQAIVKRMSIDGAAFPELRDLVEETLVPLLDGSAQKRTPEASLSALRNQLAHGGGVTQAAAQKLLTVWKPRLQDAFSKFAWLADVTLVVKTKDGFAALRGPQTAPSAFAPPEDSAALATAFAQGREIVALRRGVALALWPLAVFGHPKSPDPEAPPAREQAPQVFARRGDVWLQYTPVGSEEVCLAEGDEDGFSAFLRMFRPSGPKPAQRLEVRGFEADFQRDGEKLVGRSDELHQVRAAIDSTTQGVLWLSGPAGIGKSFLVARIVSELLEQPPSHTLVLPYRFKTGDDRCSRDAFLRFAIERIEAWDGIAKPEKPEEEQDEKRPKRPHERLKELLSALGENRVLFVIDGLDEVAERDPRFATEVPLALRLPNVTWFCAGRPERGLPEVFTPESCTLLFPDGLPPMGAGDIRTMLLEKIGPLRKRLVSRDRDQGDAVVNPFVDRVAESAGGLPLYVTYVIGDVLSNRFRALDAGERLPPSLAQYHEELLKRCEIGILRQALTPLACTLAVAHEPLTAEALEEILRRGNVLPEGEDGLPLVKRALAAIASMLRRSTTPEGAEGFTLYHHSLRQHMEESPETKPALATARRNLCGLAQDPRGKEMPAAPYLFRQGITHLTQAARRDEALALLCSFDYLMLRLQVLGDPSGVPGISADWRQVQRLKRSDAATRSGKEARDIDEREERLWESFWREREHILRRGDDHWRSYKILLQLAIEHADDSPVTKQAEAWLDAGHCDWLWLGGAARPQRAFPSACLRVIEDHARDADADSAELARLGFRPGVFSAARLADGYAVSWDSKTVRIWDVSTWSAEITFEHSVSAGAFPVEVHTGALVFVAPDGRTLLLAETLPVVSVRPLRGHEADVRGALALDRGRFVTWSEDGVLLIWHTASPGGPSTMNHGAAVVGAHSLSGERLLSWGSGQSLRLWNTTECTCISELNGHRGQVRGACGLAGGRILSWSTSDAIIWDEDTAVPITRISPLRAGVEGATRLSDETLVSWRSHQFWHDSATGGDHWSFDRRIIGVVESTPGAALVFLDGPQHFLMDLDRHSFTRVQGQQPYIRSVWSLGDARAMTTGAHTVSFWDTAKGTELTCGEAPWLAGAAPIGPKRVVAWGSGVVRVWDIESGAQQADWDGSLVGTTSDHSIVLLRESQFWRGDVQTGILSRLQTSHTEVSGAHALRDRLVTWTQGPEVLVLSILGGDVVSTLRGHRGRVEDAILLRTDRVLSSAQDGTCRLWDASSGECLLVLQGYSTGICAPLAERAKELTDHLLVLPHPDGHLALIDVRLGHVVQRMRGHRTPVDGILPLSSKTFLARSEDRSAIWSVGESLARVLLMEGFEFSDCLPMPHERMLGWNSSFDPGPGTHRYSARIWDTTDGEEIAAVGYSSRFMRGPGRCVLALASNALILHVSVRRMTSLKSTCPFCQTRPFREGGSKWTSWKRSASGCRGWSGSGVRARSRWRVSHASTA